MTAAAVRSDVDRIRTAAVDAVRPGPLVARRLAVAGGQLTLDGRPFSPPVALGGRVAVVGGGKAAAGVASAVEQLLEGASPGLRVAGLVSVPEGCGRTAGRIEIRETRPAGVNLPTAAALAATREMRGLLAGLGPDDLAVVIVTGGGSAVVEEPREGVSLAGTIAVARHLAAAGAGIRDLNTVRQAISTVKAGGLARGCSAGRLVALVLSDVIGDPLDLVASGPCTARVADPAAALEVLRRHAALDVDRAITRLLDHEAAAGRAHDIAATVGEWTTPSGCRVSHVVLGTNATAVDAAAAMARRLGYETAVRPPEADVAADVVGARLASEAAEVVAAAAADGRPRAILEGGEATVVLPRDHGLGGRNQQTAAAALAAWRGGWPAGLAVASIGTDGEDGPTDAAGGVIDADVAAAIMERRLDVAAAVRRCDAHPLLAAAGGLIRTGPTGTNVADVRLILARP